MKKVILKLAVAVKKPLILLGSFIWVYFGLPAIIQAEAMIHDDLFSVSFPDDRNGWACGRRGTILYSADGGKNWGAQTSGTKYTLLSIFFLDPRTGWAVGDVGTILHTRDGGNTWQKQKSPVPYYLMDVFFVSPQKGWIVTERTHILHTNDGGKSWSVQFKKGDLILKAVSFSDPLHGWAVGEFGYIYHTRDGGRSWRHQSGYSGFNEERMEIVGDPFLFDVEAVDSQRVWAVGIDGHVIRTQDGGQTWETVDVGAPKIHLFAVTSDKKGTVLIGGDRDFYASVDDGKSWFKPEFRPPIVYGWLYGLARRSTSEFTAVGFKGWIYNSSSVASWKRMK